MYPGDIPDEGARAGIGLLHHMVQVVVLYMAICIASVGWLSPAQPSPAHLLHLP